MVPSGKMSSRKGKCAVSSMKFFASFCDFLVDMIFSTRSCDTATDPLAKITSVVGLSMYDCTVIGSSSSDNKLTSHRTPLQNK